MTLAHAALARARGRYRDPSYVLPRLKITTRQGKVVRLSRAAQPDGSVGISPEQQQIIEALQTYRYVLILKPRQIGSTTITQAWAFHYAWKCKDPIDILTMTHESGACQRVNRMLRAYWRSLPTGLRPPLETDNSDTIQLGHNHATMRQYMAGGRGQGRSWTYHIVLFTEMGLYPSGSASVKGKGDADRDAVSSVLATMHDGPHKRVIIESTGDGPRGMFYDMVKVARASKEWAFLFFRWYDFAHYAITPPEEWERRDDEVDLGARIAEALGVDEASLEVDRRLAWRRRKLEDEGYSVMRFRREYPETWEEPFLLSEDNWFDGELLNRVLARLAPDSRKDLRVYRKREPGHRYFIGMDTSGGVGRDFAVIVVLREDFEVCAVWSSNVTQLHHQADQAHKLQAAYTVVGDDGEQWRPPILCERNKYGGAVIARLKKLGARLWTDRKGKDFWMQGGPAGETKHMVYSHAQRMVNHMHACSAAKAQPPLLNDARLVHELIIVREDEKGNIQAPEGDGESAEHDDHADAYVLALWCAREYTVVESGPPQTHAEAQQQFRRQVRGPNP